MAATPISHNVGLEADPSAGASRDRSLLTQWISPYGAVRTILGFSLVADILLPRGATAAIGYCLVPVIARTSGRTRVLVFLTGVCTALTWVGYMLEPAGASAWMSIFDRAMVTGVLWLTLLLAWRGVQADNALRDVVEELHRSNAELENFASIVSHDIRGPLNSVRLALRVVSERPAISSDEESKRWIKSIDSEINRMSDLVQTLLAYARAGGSEINLSQCDCDAVLANVRQALRAEVEGSGAEITNHPLPVIHADPNLMTELFQNLIENALKYRKATPPKVHVSAKTTQEGWLFSVRDNGVGMTAQECSRVFEVLYRGASAASSSGLGLGLATCKQIVNRHTGRIEVDSQPGEGSTFRFFIPSCRDSSSRITIDTSQMKEAKETEQC